MTTNAMLRTFTVREEPTDAQLDTLARLRSRWRLTICQVAATLWMTPDEARSWDRDDPASVQRETLVRLALADDIDVTLSAVFGGTNLTPYWLRMRNPALAGTPLAELAGRTAALRQLRWRLRAELAERRIGARAK